MNQQSAKKAILGMFNCFNFSGDEAERCDKLECYWAVLGDLTPEEIVSVCTLAARGGVGNGKFLPTTAELWQAARPAKHQVKSPDWRPHQDRFLSSSGTLYVTEGGSEHAYTPEELSEFGYALPKPPNVLNQTEIETRGMKSLHPPAANELISENKNIQDLIANTASKIRTGFGD